MSATHTYIKKIINNHFGSNKISIVDYGCGNGELINYLNNSDIKNYHGYDVSNDCIVVANNKFSKKKFSFKIINKNSLPKLGAKNSKDLIILIGVLQYMNKKEVNYLLKEAKKVLTKNGALIISCAVDHPIYKAINLYKFFIPNHYVNRKKILSKLSKNGFKITLQKEKGLIIAPMFSNIFSLFFDAADRIIFKTSGDLGPIGKTIRKIIEPITKLEYLLPIDFGYTLYIRAKKTI